MSTTTVQLDNLLKENLRLKAENERLKDYSSKPAGRPLSWVRKVSIILLVSFSVALLSIANVLFWTGNTITKQDRFVAAAEPIIKDPTVQKTMSLYAVNNIFTTVDVQNVIESVLPPRADFLAPQLSSQLKSATQSTFQKTLATESFQNKWNQIIANQHQRLITFASKYEGDGDISLNDVFNRLTASLSGTKLSFLADKQLPAKVGDISVISAPWLPAFHNVVTNIDTWRLAAVLLLVGSLALGTWLSRNRRKVLYTFAGVSAVMMAVSLIAANIAKSNIVGKADPQYQDGVASALQIVLHSFVIQTITIFFAVLFVGFIAWISGPSAGAASTKKSVTPVFNDNLHNRVFSQENLITSWVFNHRQLLEWSIVATLGAIMLLVRLTLLGLLIYGLVMLAGILLVEFLAGATPAASLKRAN